MTQRPLAVASLVPLLVPFVVLGTPGCGKKDTPVAKPAPSASVAAASSAVPKGSASASSSAPPAASSPPKFAPALAARTPEEQKGCEVKTREMDQGLASGTMAIAAKSKEFAVAYFYSNKVKGEGLVAFSGYDTSARPLGQPHGLGKGLTARPHIVPRKDQWVALWFDGEGLLFGKSGWAPSLPTVERLRALTSDEAVHTAIIRKSTGAIVATAPVAPGPTAQLGLFEFGSEDGEPMRALGTSHGAHKPQHPALVEVEDGYIAAWEDEPEGKPPTVTLARFDLTGREIGQNTPMGEPQSRRPALANTKAGALVAWDEGEGDKAMIMVRALDAHGVPVQEVRTIARGTGARLVSMGDRTALSFVDFVGRASVVSLDDTGQTHPVLLVLSGKNPVSEAPAMAFADEGKLGVGYVQIDGMKAILRVIKVEGCFDAL